MQESMSVPNGGSTDRNSDSSVSRRFSVEGLNDRFHAQTIARVLTQQPGVQSVKIDLQHDGIHVHYDNAMIGVETVIAVLKNEGYPPRQRFWDRLKYAWWRYLDENAHSNATSASGPCCSNPAALHAQRQRH